jgi:hypothetical protein
MTASKALGLNSNSLTEARNWLIKEDKRLKEEDDLAVKLGGKRRNTSLFNKALKQTSFLARSPSKLSKVEAMKQRVGRVVNILDDELTEDIDDDDMYDY